MLGVFVLCRRLHYFDIKYIEYEIELDDLEESVRKEMNGPGNLLGYRALHKKIREVHGQKVPRNGMVILAASKNEEVSGNQNELERVFFPQR